MRALAIVRHNLTGELYAVMVHQGSPVPFPDYKSIVYAAGPLDKAALIDPRTETLIEQWPTLAACTLDKTPSEANRAEMLKDTYFIVLAAHTLPPHKPTPAHRAIFENLQRRYRELDSQLWQYRAALKRRYGEIYYAKQREQDHADRMEKRLRTIASMIMSWLDENSPRNWHTNAPSHYIYTELTYDDATTDGPLATIPPLCYGQVRIDPRFVGAI